MKGWERRAQPSITMPIKALKNKNSGNKETADLIL